jgi:Novel STAND NTPase 2/TIR domain
MADEIFISYSAKDKKIADAICQALEEAGLDCWIAPRDITPGAKYAEALIDGINNCKIFLLILSFTSNESPQVEMEVDRAASKNITILSFRIDPVVLSKTMEYYLSNRHWLDASTGEAQAYLPTLVHTARRLLEHLGEISIKSKPMVQVAQVLPEKTAQAALVNNPFTFGNPIHDPERFFGRRQEIRQILNRLLSSAHESTSIIGERRIGKTSLLVYLANPKVAAQLGLTPEKFCIAYIDFQGLTDITPTRFWQRVLKKMSRSVCDEDLKPSMEKLSVQEHIDLFDLEDLFQTSHEKRLTTVLMMDEFEYVTQNPNFKSDFFGGLRALSIHHGVALLPATRRELVDLCHSEEIKGSPFFNIFANVVLRPFTRTEVDELLDGYSAQSNARLSSAEHELIFQFGGGYPFFVQIAGYYYLEGKGLGLAGDKLEQFMHDNFDLQADAHYSYLWSHCSESEKTSLFIILTLGLQEPSRKIAPDMETLSRLRSRTPQDLAALERRGMLEERDGIYSIFSASFARWVHREVVVLPGEEEDQQTIEEWLDSGHRDQLAQGKGYLSKFKKKYWPILAEVMQELSFAFADADAREIIKGLHQAF